LILRHLSFCVPLPLTALLTFLLTADGLRVQHTVNRSDDRNW
jgi:hypothetical protein